MSPRRRKYYQLAEAYKHLKNPQRYVGRRPITLRSGLEINFVMKFLDTHPSIVKWSSESIIVPYYFPVTGRRHRYFVDFWFENDQGDEFLIEVKPKGQTSAPKQPKRKTKGYVNAVNDWIKNQAKWQAAERYAVHNGMEFKILTEQDIPS